MELTKSDDLSGKLISVLKKTIECKKFDSVYTEKFLASVSKEFCNICENIYVPEFSEWLSETFQKWKQTTPNVEEAIFICKLVGILIKTEQGFEFLLNCNALTELTNFLQSDVFNQTAVTPVYISFLSDVLTHTVGYEWVKNTNQWKTVSKLYFSNYNLYVEREGLNFLKAFISKVVFDDQESNEILQDIFLPLNKYNENNVKDLKFCSVILLYLKLIQSLLEVHIFYKSSFFFNKLTKVFDLQVFLDFLMENSKQEIILEKASVLKVICCIFRYDDKKELLHSDDLSAVFDLFSLMLKNNQFNGIIKLAKYCQLLWSEMRKEMKCESKAGVQYIIMQLLPALICIKPGTSYYNDHIQKLFLSTTTQGQKFCSSFTDDIIKKLSPKPRNLALKGILSVISSTECLNPEEVDIIFQAMIYMLISFTKESSSSSQLVYFKESETLLDSQDTAILSAILNALCVLIEKFKIRWCESLESLCLVKTTCGLLENPNLPPVVVVQVFLLVKLAILNFTSPDSSLLLYNAKNSGFEWLMSLLFKRLHDPNWEIRDSCLEVVTAIVELKHPAFEELLVEKKFSSLVFDIMEGDSESYVRASAIQALTEMLKIESLSQFLITMGVSQKIIQLLQNESEAIVRREAALMIKQLYLAKSDSYDEAKSFYEVMGYSAICDLHWEVKLNSLIFWEAVIKQTITTHSVINGYIPNITFSKQENEAKSRLDKILKKLSETGCLYVLLTTLNDDCDMPVIRKSAQILSELMISLEPYGIKENFQNVSITDGIPMKRKNTVLDSEEYSKNPNLTICDDLGEINSESFNNMSVSSDTVIDEIVNEMDINLLGVCLQKNQNMNSQKKILLKEVKPETFLLQMLNFNIEKFLENKQKWLMNVEVDFKSLLQDNGSVNSTDETNIMDCY